jgi:hypothetical protein
MVGAGGIARNCQKLQGRELRIRVKGCLKKVTRLPTDIGSGGLLRRERLRLGMEICSYLHLASGVCREKAPLRGFSPTDSFSELRERTDRRFNGFLIETV